jgi:hypothetical protein
MNNARNSGNQCGVGCVVVEEGGEDKVADVTAVDVAVSGEGATHQDGNRTWAVMDMQACPLLVNNTRSSRNTSAS